MSGDYIIWHNPKCSTSRFVLNALVEAGLDPVVRDYQKDPPSVAELRAAARALGQDAGALLRRKDAPPEIRDLQGDALLAALAAEPKLIERPLVLTPDGAVMCRPKEVVFDLVLQGASD